MAYKWSSPDVASRPIAIVGGGVLGRRLCMMWASNGHSILLVDQSTSVIEEALAYVEANIDAQVAVINGKRGSVRAATSLEEACKDAWQVIEAIPERIDLKIPIMGTLDKITQPDCIIATNSSSYKSSEMIERVKGTYRVLNTHYFMPPTAVGVELMTCGHTDPAVIEFMKLQTAAVGFLPVHAKVESTGFILNRIWAAMKREALLEMSQGVSTPEEIDLLFKSIFGAKVGICQMMDSVGLDTVYNIEKHYVAERNIDPTPMNWLKATYLDKGMLGNKSGQGLLTEKEEV